MAIKEEYGEVLAVCISEKKGVRKHPVDQVTIRVGEGIVEDSHSGNWHRQVSILADESVDVMRELEIADFVLSAGDFAENILTRGVELKTLPVGTAITIGDVNFCVTQIGKECHHNCEIRQIVGTCVMPKEGIFVVAQNDGIIRPGDKVCVKRYEHETH